MIAKEHYATLGVPHTATLDEIRAAYRRRARECHPDSPGGSEEAWSRLAEAYRILSFPDLRDLYDRTGESGEAPRYKPEVDPRVLLVMGEVVRNIASTNESLTGQDMMEWVERQLANIRVKIAERVAEAERVLARLETLQARKKRRRRRGRTAKNDILSIVLQGQIGVCTRSLEEFRDQLRIHDEVMEIFAEYGYQWEMPLPPPRGFQPWSGLIIR